MSNFEVNQRLIDLISLLGKEVGYTYKAGGMIIETDGMLTSVVVNLNGSHEFCVDGQDYYSFDEVLEFKVLD